MKRSTRSNIIIVTIVLVLLIPQTRRPIQVWINSAVATFVNPSPIDEVERKVIGNYTWNLKDDRDQVLDFRTLQGKVIVINFWATWCPPCIAEMPSLEALYQNFKANEDVVFLFVTNEAQEVVSEFMNKNQYTFPVYQALTKYPSEFDVTTIPHTFVIGKGGEIVIDKTGVADWDSDLVKETIATLLKGS